MRRRPGHHQGIISRETFARVQQRLANYDPRTEPRKDRSKEFPLRGLLVCADCGGHLTGAFTKGRSKYYRYYICQNRKCENRHWSLNADKMEEQFKSLLTRNRLKPQVAKLTSVVFDRVWQQETEILRQSERMAEHTRTELKKEIKELAAMSRQATSDAVRRAYEQEIEDTTKNLENLDQLSSAGIDLSVPYRTALDKSVGMLKKPATTWDLFDVHEQHRLFFFLFDAKLSYSEKDAYRTGNKLSTTKLFEEFATNNSDNVQTTCKTLNRIKNYLAEFWSFYQSSEKLQRALE